MAHTIAIKLIWIFGCYDDAESFLLRDKTIVRAEQQYAERFFNADDVIFQSTTRYMSDTPDDEQIPVLYSIHHCFYDRYPYEADVLELSDETIKAMKEAIGKFALLRYMQLA